MFIHHYPLRFALTICIIVIIHGAVSEKAKKEVAVLHAPAMYEVSSLTYIDRSNMTLFVRQHIQIENKTHHIYISPLALFDVNQTTLIINPTTNRTTMIIPLILYTDEQIKFIQENNTKQCKQNTTTCLFHEISTETMRVIYKHAPDQINLFNSYHRYIQSLWLSYNPLLNQRLLYVNIDCTSNETCSKLDEALHRSKKPIGLHLEYAIQEPEQHQMIISHKHLLKTNIHSAELILEGDVEQFLHELLRAADVRNNETYVLSQVDLFLLKETLRKQLLGKTLILTAENDEKQWNSIYWKTNNILRPDRVFKLLKKKVNSTRLSKKRTNGIDIHTEMDNYVRKTYDKQSFDLYLKYRHLFELVQTNGTQKESTSSSSLKLKPMLAFELNKFNRSRFLVHQPIHMTKRDDILLIPIRSILPSKEIQSTSNRTNNDSNELEELRRIIEKLQKSLADCEPNKGQSLTTASIPESTTIETTDSGEQQWASTNDLVTTSVTSTEITVTTNENETPPISMTTEIPDAVVKHGLPHGTLGGGSFDDAVNLKLSPATPCVGVQLFWEPDYLFAIRFIYQQDNSSIRKVYHGGFGDPDKYVSSLLNETFMMNDEERINKVTWYVGTSTWVRRDGALFPYVLGIQFCTTTGRTSRLYGSNKGEVYTESYKGFTLGYAKGRSGFLVDMLQFVWYNQEPVSTLTRSPSSSSTTSKNEDTNRPKWDGYYKFKNVHSGLVMDVTGGSVNNSAAVIQFHDNGHDWQKWRVEYAGNDQYLIIAKHSQLLLDSAGWSNGDGAPLLQYIANGGNNQKWQIVQVPGEKNVVKLINIHARNKLISVPRSSKEAGVQLHVWGNRGNDDQKWMMIPI